MGQVFEDYGVVVSFVVSTDSEFEFNVPVSGVHCSFCAVRGVRTPELGAAGAFVSFASSMAMVVLVL